MSKNFLLSRREMLRGVGAFVALPFLESLVPLKAFAGVPSAMSGAPKRFVIVTVTGGTVAESWVPTTAGVLGPKLPSILRPL